MSRKPTTSRWRIRWGAWVGASACAAVVSLVLALVSAHLDSVVAVGKAIGLLPKYDPWVQARITEVQHVSERLPDGAILLLGDSIIERLPASDVGPGVYNLGIASLTALTMATFLPDLKPLRAARAAVLGIGGNDLGFRAREDILRDYAALVAHVPAATPLVTLGILPMDEADPFVQSWPALRNANIDALNAGIRTICEARAGCLFLWMQPVLADATGNLRQDMHVGDGRHLSAEGTRRLAEALREALSQALRGGD